MVVLLEDVQYPHFLIGKFSRMFSSLSPGQYGWTHFLWGDHSVESMTSSSRPDDVIICTCGHLLSAHMFYSAHNNTSKIYNGNALQVFVWMCCILVRNTAGYNHPFLPSFCCTPGRWFRRIPFQDPTYNSRATRPNISRLPSKGGYTVYFCALILFPFCWTWPLLHHRIYLWDGPPLLWKTAAVANRSSSYRSRTRHGTCTPPWRSCTQTRKERK